MTPLIESGTLTNNLQLVRKLFLEADKNQVGKLEKDVLYKYAVKNSQLQMVVEENIRSIRRIDKLIENDLQEPFQVWAPASSGL